MSADSIDRWQALTPALDVSKKSEVQVAPSSPRPVGWPLLVAAGLFLLSELLLANYRLTIRRDGTRAREVSQ